jgi:hypothetical protein
MRSRLPTWYACSPLLRVSLNDPTGRRPLPAPDAPDTQRPRIPVPGTAAPAA